MPGRQLRTAALEKEVNNAYRAFLERNTVPVSPQIQSIRSAVVDSKAAWRYCERARRWPCRMDYATARTGRSHQRIPAAGTEDNHPGHRDGRLELHNQLLITIL